VLAQRLKAAEMMTVTNMMLAAENPSMVGGYLSYKFAGLWPLLWHFGLGGVIVIACVALYIFTPAFLSRIFPNIQKTLLWVAAIVIAIMVSIGIGVHLGEQRIQAQWDQARANAVENGKKARAGAIRDVARKPSRWLPAHKDIYDRDGH
jgi:hypothetical protein